jgi:hypothetical protein
MPFKSSIHGAEANARLKKLALQYREFDDFRGAVRFGGGVRLGRLLRLQAELPPGSPAQVAIDMFLADYLVEPAQLPRPSPAGAQAEPPPAGKGAAKRRRRRRLQRAPAKPRAVPPPVGGTGKRPRKKRDALVTVRIHEAIKANYSDGDPGPLVVSHAKMHAVIHAYQGTTPGKAPPSYSQVWRARVEDPKN